MTTKQQKPYLLYLIIILLSVIIISGWFKWDNRGTKELEKQLIISEKRVDSLNMVNKGLSSEISVISAQINKLNTQLYQNKNEIDNLKQEYRLKQEEIDLYDYNNLIEFFNTRYNTNIIP
jgi:peptidoglycan hydrolase CwlO-like protein